MAYILNIHTATETAIVNLVADAEVLGTISNHETKQHASFLHTAINGLLRQCGIDIKEVGVIGVTAGPGSYTGIRVGLATAKGLCYALKIPLITYNALEVMAITATNYVKDIDALYCPMIDARRMEVYTAVYNYDIKEIASPAAVILDQDSFAEILDSQKIFFSGKGSDKFKPLLKRENSSFLDLDISTEALAKIAWEKYTKSNFENVPYAQPLYIK